MRLLDLHTCTVAHIPVLTHITYTYEPPPKVGTGRLEVMKPLMFFRFSGRSTLASSLNSSDFSSNRHFHRGLHNSGNTRVMPFRRCKGPLCTCQQYCMGHATADQV